MSGALSRLTALGLLAVGGLLGLVAAAQPWWRLVGDSPEAPVDARITGAAASGGLAQILPACLLIAALLTLVVRAVGRRVVAVLAGLLGIGTAVLGGWHPRPDPGTVQQTLRQSSLADSAALSGTAWPWIYLVAGLLGVAGAGLVLTRARTWPTRADRYAVGPAAAAAAASADPDTWWKAMDAGLDPTLEPTTDPTLPDGSGTADPISDPDGAGATMASGTPAAPGSAPYETPPSPLSADSPDQQPGNDPDTDTGSGSDR